MNIVKLLLVPLFFAGIGWVLGRRSRAQAVPDISIEQILQGLRPIIQEHADFEDSFSPEEVRVLVKSISRVANLSVIEVIQRLSKELSFLETQAIETEDPELLQSIGITCEEIDDVINWLIIVFELEIPESSDTDE